MSKRGRVWRLSGNRQFNQPGGLSKDELVLKELQPNSYRPILKLEMEVDIISKVRSISDPY